MSILLKLTLKVDGMDNSMRVSGIADFEERFTPSSPMVSKGPEMPSWLDFYPILLAGRAFEETRCTEFYIAILLL